MHELPQDLTSSLRSWRGSIHGNNAPPLDIEKAAGFDKETDARNDGHNLASQTSSLILHPTKSRLNLYSQYQQQNQQHNTATQAVARRKLPAPNAQPKTAQQAPEQPTGSDPTDSHDPESNKPLSPQDFYELIGMNAPRSKDQIPKKLAATNGLYETIKSKERSTNRSFKIFDAVVYILLGLQLLLSAVFIILGSLTTVDSHVAIAVLGAVSTVIAGSLALMKGQGLPNRLRMTRGSLRKVLFEAEELYWDVGAGRSTTFGGIKKIREDYLSVLKEAEMNHPDFWDSSATSAIAKGVSGMGGKGGKAGAAGVGNTISSAIGKELGTAAGKGGGT